MSVFGPRAHSRSATLLVVAAMHGLMLWGIWQARVPVEKQAETFASVMFFLPEAAPHRTGSTRAISANRAKHSIPLPVLQPSESDTAITLPPTPAAEIDWSAQLKASAQGELAKEQTAPLVRGRNSSHRHPRAAAGVAAQ